MDKCFKKNVNLSKYQKHYLVLSELFTKRTLHNVYDIIVHIRSVKIPIRKLLKLFLVKTIDSTEQIIKQKL